MGDRCPIDHSEEGVLVYESLMPRVKLERKEERLFLRYDNYGSYKTDIKNLKLETRYFLGFEEGISKDLANVVELLFQLNPVLAHAVYEIKKNNIQGGNIPLLEKVDIIWLLNNIKCKNVFLGAIFKGYENNKESITLKNLLDLDLDPNSSIVKLMKFLETYNKLKSLIFAWASGIVNRLKNEYKNVKNFELQQKFKKDKDNYTENDKITVIINEYIGAFNSIGVELTDDYMEIIEREVGTGVDFIITSIYRKFEGTFFLYQNIRGVHQVAVTSSPDMMVFQPISSNGEAVSVKDINPKLLTINSCPATVRIVEQVNT